MYRVFISSGLVVVGLSLNVQAQEPIELVTVTANETHWTKKIHFNTKKKTKRKTVLYLKKEMEPSHSLVPVIEVTTQAYTILSTRKGQKYATDLQRGDEVYCRNTKGVTSYYEVGVVYNAK